MPHFFKNQKNVAFKSLHNFQTQLEALGNHTHPSHQYF